MNREMLQKLFQKIKRSFREELLFPVWICKGKKEIENRNSPQRAAVYLDIPIPCAGLLYYEKEKACIKAGFHKYFFLYNRNESFEKYICTEES